MAYYRNQFYDPATAELYSWHINHSEEDAFGKTRNVNAGAPTGLNGLIMQQGDDSPMDLELSGTILHLAQYTTMLRFFAISRARSIYFRDFWGQEFEVVITSFTPQAQRTLRNPRDKTIPLHYWKYTIRMRVLAFRAGPWAQVGVTP